MTTLVLTIVGADRAGIVAEVAAIVAEHGGNWERSELAELSGAFAGIVEVSVTPERTEDLRAALASLESILTVAVHEASADTGSAASGLVTIDVIGNDRAGIVREITGVLQAHDLSIDRMTTETREAAMFGGRLFEASVIARVPPAVDLDVVASALEQLASEIHVDVTIAG